MHEAAATPAWVLLAYLVSGVCFNLALRGLSNPESSRRGNYIGMVGMAIAVGTTLMTHLPRTFERIDELTATGQIYASTTISHFEALTFGEILIAILIGGGIGL